MEIVKDVSDLNTLCSWVVTDEPRSSHTAHISFRKGWLPQCWYFAILGWWI